ncbi:E3 SUMO-protein ligase PIAS3 isoform X2 [Ischnura elegans]|nr:E3 SUMO-protein ligase PIAS3 isoform X2 [Ischnura elegans]
MVLSFRVSELQMLLGFAGRNKTGRKTELQTRALDLLKLRSAPITIKIKELYKTIQHGMVSLHSLSSSSFSREMTMQQQAQQQQVASQHAQQVPSLAHHGHHSLSHHSNPVHHHHQQQAQQTQQHLTRIPYPTYGAQQVDRSMQGRGGSVYPGSLYHQYPPKAPPAPPVQYPIHPDVRFKKLPFYEQITELLRPSTLLPQGPGRYQEATFVFHLTPQQATDVASCRDLLPGSKVDYVIQVQMRFCLLETSCEQDDAFPPGINLKVNGKLCPLPNPIPTNKAGVEPKRPSRPVNITPLVKLCPAMANQVSVQWAPEFNRNYATCIYLVRKLTSSDLLLKMKNRGLRHPDFTRGLIKEKLNEEADNEIATTSLKASLVCPLGKMRMATPCRATTCYHLQCFDASLYLQMNEKKPMWICPVCDKPAIYDNLVIDGYFQEVLLSGKLPSDSNDIQLHGDGSWSPSVVKKDPSLVVPCAPMKVETPIETVSDDAETPVVVATEVKKQPVVVDLTLSDSDEEGSGKMAVTSIPDLSFPELTSHSVPSTVAPLNSTGSNSSRTHSERRGGAGHVGRGGSSVGQSSSVSSSGYVSPSVITLDSPSPPPASSVGGSPQALPTLPMPVFPTTSPSTYTSALPPQTSPSSTSSSSSSSSPGLYTALRPRRVRNANRQVIFSTSSSSSSSASVSPLPSPPLEAIASYQPPSVQPVSSSSPQVPQQHHVVRTPHYPQPMQAMSSPIPPPQPVPQHSTMQTMPQQTMPQQTMPQQSMAQQSMAQPTLPMPTLHTQQAMEMPVSSAMSMPTQHQQQGSMASTSPLLDMFVPVLPPPYLDLDSDSNGSHSGGTSNIFHRY